MNRDIQGRIKRMVKELCDDNKAEFCRRIGKKDPSAIKDIVGDKGSTPSFNLLYDILSSDLGISPKWLMLGEGPMMENETQPTPQNDIHHNRQVVIANWGDLKEIIADVIKTQSK